VSPRLSTHPLHRFAPSHDAPDKDVGRPEEALRPPPATGVTWIVIFRAIRHAQVPAEFLQAFGESYITPAPIAGEGNVTRTGRLGDKASGPKGPAEGVFKASEAWPASAPTSCQ